MTRTTTRSERRVFGPFLLAALLVSACGVLRAQDQRVEGQFERTATVSGAADVHVTSGSGRIEVRTGDAGRIQVTARIVADDRWSMRRGDLNAAERVRRIEANPPFTQDGNRIRIGNLDALDDEVTRNVSISYVVTVPRDTTLVAGAGSGSVEIDGVARRVEVTTGSGSIRIRNAGADVNARAGSGSISADTVGGALDARTGSGSIDGTGVAGAIRVTTGSGSIDVSQSGRGDAQASTGSGSIRLAGIRGALRVTSTSGTIRIDGEQAGDWRLESTSGGVYVDLSGSPAFNLDARTRSGSIDLAYPVTMSGRLDKREVRGAVNGGGPLLEVRTSSGSIHIR
ncbi:MAG: DUF4097 family beta strand repeat-containing protein [Vicinamibacterales bacterium]